MNNIRSPYYALTCGVTSDYFEEHNHDIFSPEIHSKLLNRTKINDNNKVLTCAFNKVLTKSYLNLPQCLIVCCY